MKVLNGVVEVVNSYDDGEISVRKCGLSEWEWLYCVMGGSENERNGSVELVRGDSWEEVESVLKKEFEEYKENEIKDGYGVGCDEDGNDVEFDWEKVEKELFDGVKELYGDGWNVNKVLVGGYGVECDSEFVVIVMKSE